MSASTPKPPANSVGHAAEEPRRRWPLWAVLSAVFHGLVLAWLVFLRPPVETAGAMTAQGRNAALNVAPERLEEVAEQINATQADEVRAKVEELQDIQRELATVSQEKQAVFAGLARDLATEAPRKAEDAQTSADAAQAEAEKAEAEAADATAEWKQAEETAAEAATAEDGMVDEARANAALAQARSAQARAKTAQTAATDAQARAAQQTGFGDSAFAEAKARQAEANSRQEEANRQQDAATDLVNTFSALQRQAQRTQGSAETARRGADLARSRVDSHQLALTRAQAEIEKQKAMLDSAEAAAADARTQGQGAADERSKATAAAAEKRAGQAADRARASLAAAQDRAKRELAEIDKARAAAAAAGDKAAAAEAEADKPADELATIPARIVAAQRTALEAQQQARSAQTRARTALADAQASPQTVASAATPAPPPPAAPIPAADLDGKSFAELYMRAVDTEKNIAAEYTEIRTEETATRQQIPLDDARKIVQAVQPARPALDPVLAGGQIDTAALLNAHNAAMEKALEQLNSMLALARGMASQTRNSPNGLETSGLNLTDVADVKAEAAAVNELGRLGTEGQAGDVAVDLTEMMKAIAAGGTASGKPPEMAADGSGTLAQGQGHGEGPGQGSRSATGADTPEGSGPQGGIGKSGRPGSGAPGTYGLPPVGAVLNSVPGRRVHAEGNGAGSQWMFVDDWYVVGPFPNPARRNIDTKFPPESVVDLDATYPGKDGRLLRWRFVQATQAAIHPPDEQPYAIYYAFTTLWFDEERDAWIAVGSDDFSKLWINGLPVWASGLIQKTWKPNEGYRKVHFRRGLNRLLYRVENGQAACMYSLMLRTDEHGS